MYIPTYDQFQRMASTLHDTYLSTCEIADGKAQLGFPVDRAWNRKDKERLKTCRSHKVVIMRRIVLDLNRNRRIGMP